jgi:hypothetical protein
VARSLCKETEDDAYEEFKQLERTAKNLPHSVWLTLQVHMNYKWTGDTTPGDSFTTESQQHSLQIDSFLPNS